MNTQTMWRRRAALMAVVGLLAAVPITLLIRDDDTEEPALPTQPATTAVEPAPQTGPDEKDRDLGVTYRVPEGWDESREASAIRLSSRDETAEIVIAAPAPAEDAEPLLEQTLDAFRAEYEDVEIAPGGGREIGGIESEGAVVTASRGDQELRILVAVAAGKERAYLVEVFTTPNVSPESLRAAQVALNSVEFAD